MSSWTYWADLGVHRGAVEVGIALRHRMNRRARSQSGQMMLNRTDLVQQPERIQCPGQRPQTVLHPDAHPGGWLQPWVAAALPDRRRHAPEPAGAGSLAVAD